MRRTPWSRIREQNSVHKEFLEIVGNGKPTGNVWKETIAVRPDILWSVNKLARSIKNGPKLVTNAWIDWFQIFITRVNTNNIVMWVILPNYADWDCFKILTLPGRSWRFKIHFWRNAVRFWKSYICSSKLDVQETNCCFSQLNRIWNHLFRRWIETGWIACSGIMGSNCFCFWKYFSYFRSNGETCEW